jgi:nucleoside phosphorylase
VAAVVAGLFAGSGAMARATDPLPPGCTPRLLVLSAMPSEIGPLLAAATISESVTINKHHFYVGTLQGKAVVLGLTGIGMVNADQATRDAFTQFGCGTSAGISGVVFSGVAGGDRIGDVAVPAEWTNGTTTRATDSAMLATATAVAPSVTLTSDVAVGDPACACIDPGLVKPVKLAYTPQVLIGGKGITSDPFGGRRLPCAPNGGDVFGCEPCKMRSHTPPDVAGFATDAAPFLDPNFFFDYFANAPASDPQYKAQDMETAAVAIVADEKHVPFIGFRGVSDGAGDPVVLTEFLGFPFQFFMYRQVASDNAAAMTLAFLQAWS